MGLFQYAGIEILHIHRQGRILIKYRIKHKKYMAMKKIIGPILLAVLFSVSGCKSFIEGWDVSPNTPTEATAPLLLSEIEVATFMYYTGQLARTPSIFIQQTAGTDFQMVDIANYTLLEGDNVNEWEGLYTDCIMNEQLLINDFGNPNPYYAGIGKILKAMSLGLLTDLWGDVPNREALKGLTGVSTVELNPHFDAQETVIQDIQSLLSEAITDLSRPAEDNIIVPGIDDYIFGGDPAAWINSAWILKARYANRLSNRNPAGSANDAITFLSNIDPALPDLMSIHGEQSNEQNQWYAFQQDRGNYMQMGEYFIELLKSINDPRLPFFALPNLDGEYTGTAKNDNSTNTSDWGPYAGTAGETDLPLVTYFEAKFIEAEANLRLGNNNEAAAAYNDAVKASLLKVTGAPDTVFEALYAAEDGPGITLEKIMTQKYIAMFTQTEAWTDWRRTNLPVLEPNPDGVVDGIPRRFPTTRSERNYNSNAVVVSNILTPVWWDE
jgi:hypothetical protein